MHVPKVALPAVIFMWCYGYVLLCVAAPEWPASVDAEHLMEQLQVDDEHLRGLAKSVPLH
jgi:hypothetical protein